ncbi:hypothetical protein JGH11_04605 [Dysgonomonas sp. Marseille-P4677]|uniref:hypothetical protein n=1 Tax=Dysgonomonas sp. Marseille-P4677 TaxID=2364790 RepID=UPI00191400FB|nr:hypothetical protein [Dysgonomonas sp. Marseille-P4677]MBK5720148.1 hypothetical protein [Dysgonomonas sp. Marseille-P4677]
MKNYSILLLFCFLFACDSDKEETDEDIIKRYNEYLIGIWVPTFDGQSYSGNTIDIYRSDKTATFHAIESYKDGIYKVISTNNVFNAQVGRTSTGALKVYYDYYSKDSHGNQAVYGGEIDLYSITNETIEYYDPYLRKREVYQKVPSINIVE